MVGTRPGVKGRALVAILKGGLGNQLFIYAAARALAMRTGRQLYLDVLRGYTADDYGRSYRLNRFPIVAQLMPEAWRIAPHLRHPRHKWIRAMNKWLPGSWRTYLAERKDTIPEMLTNYASQRLRVTLLGYWQNEAYFSDAAETLRRELAPPTPASDAVRQRGTRLAGLESVFLHVRRVRYSPVLGAGYYQQAIDRACALLSRPVFVLFGDDLDWARQALDFRGATVELQPYDATDEFDDLWLMSRCRHAVVANSSFSWWGAWLGGPPGERQVWAPAPTGLPLVNAPGWVEVTADLSVMDKGTR